MPSTPTWSRSATAGMSVSEHVLRVGRGEGVGVRTGPVDRGSTLSCQPLPRLLIEIRHKLGESSPITAGTRSELRIVGELPDIEDRVRELLEVRRPRPTRERAAGDRR